MYFRNVWFLANYLTSFLGVALLMKLLQYVPGLESGLAAMLALPLLIAAMIEGQHYARVNRTRPSTNKCWVVALTMSALVGAVALVLLLLIALWQRQYALPGVNFFLIAAVTLPLLRIGYAIGLASELKGQNLAYQQNS